MPDGSARLAGYLLDVNCEFIDGKLVTQTPASGLLAVYISNSICLSRQRFVLLSRWPTQLGQIFSLLDWSQDRNKDMDV